MAHPFKKRRPGNLPGKPVVFSIGDYKPGMKISSTSKKKKKKK